MHKPDLCQADPFNSLLIVYYYNIFLTFVKSDDMKFFKVFGDKNYANNSYSIDAKSEEHMIKDEAPILMIYKDNDAKTPYLIKKMDKKNPCEIYFKLEVLREIAEGTGFFEKQENKQRVFEAFKISENYTEAEDEVLKDCMEELLANYDELEFRAQLEIFTGEFIRKVRPNCSPKYRLFKNKIDDKNAKTIQTQEKENETKNEIWVGSKFKFEYTDSVDAYKPEDKAKNLPATLFNKLIVDDFSVADDLSGAVPIIELGDCAVLRYIVGRLDCHNHNWGFVKPQNLAAYNVCLVDFGSCFAFLDSKDKQEQLKQVQLDEEDKMIVQNLNNIIKIVFESDYYSSFSSSAAFRSSRSEKCAKDLPLPESVYSSKRINNEIKKTITDLNKLTHEEIVSFLKVHFKKFPYHVNVLATEIKNNITYFNFLMQLNLRFEEIYTSKKSNLEEGPKQKIRRK